jgi:hypothetical protein
MAPTDTNPAQLILDTIPAEARGPEAAASLPDQLQAGHCYSYGGHGRMGTCWLSPAGRLTAKPNGGGLPHSWAEQHAHSLVWRHAALPCGCGQ